MLNKLNIQYEKVSSEAFDIENECRSVFDGKIPQYAQTLLSQLTATFFVGYINDERFDSNDDKHNGMFIFSTEYKCDECPTRTNMANLTRLFNRLSADKPVIVIMRSGQYISIATCERTDYKQKYKQTQGERVGKVSILRGIDCKAPHRGHLDILASLVADNKIKTFDGLYEHWQKVFSTELLTKKFYGELLDWYKWVAIDKQLHVTFPNDISTNADDEEIGTHITRLVT